VQHPIRMILQKLLSTLHHVTPMHLGWKVDRETGVEWYLMRVPSSSWKTSERVEHRKRLSNRKPRLAKS